MVPKDWWPGQPSDQNRFKETVHLCLAFVTSDPVRGVQNHGMYFLGMEQGQLKGQGLLAFEKKMAAEKKKVRTLL